MSEESLFELALNTPESERGVLLDRECGGDAELRARVEALLSAHRSPASWLAADATGPHQPAESPQRGATCAGTLVAGRYKLLQRIGEGGMGEVWMADQTEPVKRRVAVKLIRTERGSSGTILARFEAERQAIALMDHPHVAKLLDAGTTEGGQPFFVMELVKGVPLTQFCDAHKLTIPERLKLFVQICSAVQHAHQKGIIHRDLKPSNVLVESHDGRPMPKVIDFGLAKAASGMQLTEQTLFTAFGSVMGTPLYMAPEQAGASAIDVDTRADVYALGVILYELLTGSTPLDRAAVKKAAFDEVLRLIREQEPPAPSSRISTSEAKPTVAANRQTEPQKLGRFVKGELDWIVMKALSKERERRYETANGFARDVERFLAHEPVAAGPPSAAYRLRKFVRRNRAQVVAASLVLLALVAGVVGTAWQAVRAERARADEANQRAAAEENEKRAVEAAAKEREATALTAARLRQIERINDTVFDVFAEFDVHKVREGNQPVEYVLAQKLFEAGKSLDAGAIHDPVVLAKLRNRLGQTLLGLGRPEEAIELLEAAWEVRKVELGPSHADTLNSMSNLAVAYKHAGKLDRALPLYEQTFALTKARLGHDHPDTLTNMSNLAVGYQDAGHPDRALPLYEETLKLMKARFGPEHPHTLASMNNLAGGYRDAGKLGKALSLYEKTLAIMIVRLPFDHPDTLNCMNNLASGYEVAGRLDEALPLFERTLELRKAKLGPEHPDTLASMNNLAKGYWSAGRLDRSVPLFEEALPLLVKRLGRGHPNTQTTVANLGVNYKDAGELDKALPLLEEAHRASRKAPQLRWVNLQLLEGYARAGKAGETAKLAGELLAEARRTLRKGSPELGGMLAYLGLQLLEVRVFADAEPILRESLAIREQTQPDDWSTFNTQSMLGGPLLGQKKYDEAAPLLVKGYRGMKEREDVIPPQGRARLGEAIDRLIEFYTATKKPNEAKKYRAERKKYPDLLPPPMVEK